MNRSQSIAKLNLKDEHIESLLRYQEEEEESMEDQDDDDDIEDKHLASSNLVLFSDCVLFDCTDHQCKANNDACIQYQQNLKSK